jgi:hypothetical protein
MQRRGVPGGAWVCQQVFSATEKAEDERTCGVSNADCGLESMHEGMTLCLGCRKRHVLSTEYCGVCQKLHAELESRRISRMTYGDDMGRHQMGLADYEDIDLAHVLQPAKSIFPLCLGLGLAAGVLAVGCTALFYIPRWIAALGLRVSQ